MAPTVVYQAFKEPDNSTLNMRKEMLRKCYTNVPVYSTKYWICFWCFHYRINKIRYSPNVAPLFSDCESSTHTVAFYNVNTFQDKKKKKKNKYKGKWRDWRHKYNNLNYTQLYRMNHIHSTNILYKKQITQ